MQSLVFELLLIQQGITFYAKFFLKYDTSSSPVWTITLGCVCISLQHNTAMFACLTSGWTS